MILAADTRKQFSATGFGVPSDYRVARAGRSPAASLRSSMGGADDWADWAKRQISRAFLCEADWDGEGSPPASSKACDRAVAVAERMLAQSAPRPASIVGDPDGGVVFEWSASDGTLVIEVSVEGSVSGWTLAADGTSDEFEIEI